MPRSASRDLADRYAGNRGYFRHPDAIRRAKVWLALVALGLSTGWALLDATDPPRAAYSHSHGPLADPHAPWDSNCAACHKAQSFDITSPFSIFRARDRWHALTCEKCHAGPPHHAAVTGAGDAFHNQCANCHHDHNGRTNSLTRIGDSHCTNCHADLAKNHAGGVSEFESKITAFDKHPEFGPLRAFPPGVPGPRGLKFSHSLHMTPGLVYGRGGTPLTPAAMQKRFGEDPARYRTPNQADDAPVQMTCAMCHQLDAGRPPTTGPSDGLKAFDLVSRGMKDQPLNSLLPPRAEGAYYLPVNFDAHCKACHPINSPADRSGDTPITAFQLPHRKQTPELKQLMSAEYARQLTFGGVPVDKIRGETDRLTTSTMKLLFTGLTPRDKLRDRDPAPLATGGYACGKCHVAGEKPPNDDYPTIGPAETRVVWFRHAKFNHASHRTTACGECHPGTESRTLEGGETDWTDFEPIRIRGVKSCQQCHSPAGRQVELSDGEVVSGGGVRHNCTDCHRYHNGDHALAGRGTPARDPQRPRTVSEFLRGR
jgi:hypothetical protein